jgi:hypothetical protein
MNYVATINSPCAQQSMPCISAFAGDTQATPNRYFHSFNVHTYADKAFMTGLCRTRPPRIWANSSQPHIQVAFTLGSPTSPFAKKYDGSVLRHYPRRTEASNAHPYLLDFAS